MDRWGRCLQAVQGTEVIPTPSPLLNLPGAVPSVDAEQAGSGVALHYGQPIAEARHLEEGTALVDVSHRGVVTVRGADRLSWLDSMTTQAMAKLSPGRSIETLLLSPQGRIEHPMRVVDDGETTWLLVDPGHAEPLAAFLNRMRFALRVEVADESEAYAQIAAFPGEALDLMRSLSTIAEWEDPWQDVQPGGHQYANEFTATWNLSTLVIPRETLEEVRALVTSGRVRAAGISALDAVEIRAWRVGAQEIDERAIPNELDWTRTAVHLNKGCYRGQETVAKIHNIGHPPRRLTMLHIDGSEGEVPEPGALIYVEGEERPTGRVTRAAIHHDWGVIALALLKRRTPEDAALAIELASGGRAHATQEIIVPADAGATRDIPKLRRL